MKAKLRKSASGVLLKIPSSVMRAAGLKWNDPVEVRAESGRIVIEPLDYPSYDLDELIKGITSRNRHKAVDFGPPRGKEVW
jgi:antitoxin MazE